LRKILLIVALALVFQAWTYPEEELINLCNEIRREHDLPPLTINWEVARVARHKTEDMSRHNYFGHDSPVYGSFRDMLKNFNIPHSSAGENIASGSNTARAVVDAWMASPGHRRNILSESFTEAGAGYSSNGDFHYWSLILLKP